MPLSKEEKAEFVEELVESVTRSIQALIASDKIPEDWDGHELRHFIADKFDFERMHRVMTGKRLKDYRNTVILNNL